MALKAVREIARADMNDDLGVTVWQHRKQVAYTADEARELAREIAGAADEADRIRAEMLAEMEVTQPGGPFVSTASGTAVI